MKLFNLFFIFICLLSCNFNGVQDDNVKNISKDLIVCADGEVIHGIDVSYYQGDIDWVKVKNDGIDFAFIRVSDGLNFIDPKFEENWEGALQAGVIRGVYQFFRPSKDPVAQANLLLDKVQFLDEYDLPPVIDVEVSEGKSPEEIQKSIQLWISTIENELGRQPIIYTGKYFWNDFIRTNDFSDYPLWIAQYGPVCPDLPTPWEQWIFFQTSSSGSIDGITGDVDTNLFNGNIDSLESFILRSEFKCGNNICSSNESFDTCPQDCSPCELILNEDETILDNDSSCFNGGGPEEYLRFEKGFGFNDSLIWTHATDLSTTYNFAEWNLNFKSSGEYELEVFTDNSIAESKKTKYLIYHSAGESSIEIDQTAKQGWQSLGKFKFNKGGLGQKIRLNDNTGEPSEEQVKIAFDALKIKPILNEIDTIQNQQISTGSCSVSNNKSNTFDFVLVFIYLLIIIRFFR